MKRWLFTSVACIASSFAVSAQWLTLRTPGIPRTADGHPNLTAAAPQTADDRPDFTGVWTTPGAFDRPDVATVLPWAQEMARQRQDNYYRDRPSNRCRPNGPEPVDGYRRILQTPTMIAILNDDLTYRQIFMDGRALEADPHPTWMGYSVGRWEGETLVVDSVGFNDQTYLHVSGLPHTEKLRVRERMWRKDFGHLQIDVTFTDPGAYTQPWNTVVHLDLAADTEMLETVCEDSSDRWPRGRFSDARQTTVHVATDTLATYVGVYDGDGSAFGASGPTSLRVQWSDGDLSISLSFIPTPFRLVAESDHSFLSELGYVYEFIRDAAGVVTGVVEHHVVGSYTYKRRR